MGNKRKTYSKEFKVMVVEDEYTEKRAYLGIILKVNGFNYFVPLEQSKTSTSKTKK